MKNKSSTRALCALVGLLLAVTLLAPDAKAQSEVMDKLEQLLITNPDNPDIPTIPQTGPKAEAIKAILKRVQLPAGFKIDLYAIVPDARHMAVGPNVGAVFVGTRKSQVWVATDRDKDRVADEVKEFAPSLKKKFPNGVAFSKDGFLYLAEHNRVLAFPAAEFFYEGRDVAVITVVKQFFPPEEEYFNHAFRVIDVGPDDKLYISIGQPYNVWPPEKDFEDPKGTIVRMNRDGSGLEVYARGVRNSVGIDFNPVTNELWFNDNQVDGMGDDIPPGELNRAAKAGMNFGFPWYGGGKIRTNEWQSSEPPADATFPEIEWQAHTANLGMTFYEGKQFPAKYKNGLFVAQHGSWNRTTPVGAQIMYVDYDDDGNIVSNEVFAKGWLDEETGEYFGRPVDVVTLPDGSLLVSDDLVGAIYRISYQNAE